MTVRNNKRLIRINDSELYDDLFDERRVNQIKQYMTVEIGYPTVQQKSAIQTQDHVWKIGDRYYKLAHKHPR